MNSHKTSVCILAVLYCLSAKTFAAGSIDLSAAKIMVITKNSKIMTNAADMLHDEIEKRTRIGLDVVTEMPAKDQTAIVIGVGKAVTKNYPLPAALEMPAKADGYAIWVDTAKRGAPTICLAGVDERGALFAAGRLLRLLDMGRDKLSLNSDIKIATSPKYALRGHQLGYRPKTNSYDAWDLPIWEQYYRDMIVFGMNTVELVPPETDDDKDSPHFPKAKMEMMIAMSKLADDYGLDVWIWYPIMEFDLKNGQEITEELMQLSIRNRDDVLSKLPRVNAVFVPSGDPDEVHPKYLFPHMKEHKKILTKYHPGATIWSSVQNYDDERRTMGWIAAFYEQLRGNDIDWFDGVVFGPATETTLPEMRKNVPAKFPIRRYPDITHSKNCQYRVPNWDGAWEDTLGRECINPRPVSYTKIFRDLQQYAIGFITYSEGCNDDFNKVLWSCLGWDPNMDTNEIAKEYSRYFISQRYENSFADGLFDLEKNWKGNLKDTDQPYKTLELFHDMEKNATPQDKLNWRFQQGLYRAYYDAYIKARYDYERGLEKQALEVLKNAETLGSLEAMTQAQAILDKSVTQKTKPEWRARTFELAEALYQSIRMQLSVEKYQAISIQRGANLDSIDSPLSNRKRLIEEFDKIRPVGSEQERLAKIAAIAARN